MIKSVEMKLSYGEVGKRRFVFSSKWEEEYRGGRGSETVVGLGGICSVQNLK